jgi:energy-coupling factor transporter ATP-binding protein EcfA2
MYDSLNASRLFPVLLDALKSQRIALTAPSGGGKSTFLQLFAAYAQEEYQPLYFSVAGVTTELSVALLAQLNNLDNNSPRHERIARALTQHPKLLLLLDDLETATADQRHVFLADLRSDWQVPWIIAATPEFAAHIFAAHIPEASNFSLRYYDSHAIAGLVSYTDASYMSMLVELLDHNPGRLQQLWRQAQLGMMRLYSIQHKVQGFVHQPDIALMIKWLLLREYLLDAPYSYLTVEKAAAAQRAEKLRQLAPNLPVMLQAFILRDAEQHRFDKPRVLSLYLEANGDNAFCSALALNMKRLQGQTAFAHWDLSCVDFSAESLNHLHFYACDFSFSDFRGADLRHTVFANCELHGARFDDADVSDTQWQACLHLESLCTAVETYQLIAQRALHSWQAQPDWPPEALYKMYKTMFNRLAENDPQRQNIMDKGVQVRQLVQNLA